MWLRFWLTAFIKGYWWGLLCCLTASRYLDCCCCCCCCCEMLLLRSYPTGYLFVMFYFCCYYNSSLMKFLHLRGRVGCSMMLITTLQMNRYNIELKFGNKITVANNCHFELGGHKGTGTWLIHDCTLITLKRTR